MPDDKTLMIGNITHSKVTGRGLTDRGLRLVSIDKFLNWTTIARFQKLIFVSAVARFEFPTGSPRNAKHIPKKRNAECGLHHAAFKEGGQT